MNYLLDPNSLLLLIKNAAAKSTIERLQDSLILNLTFYEMGSAIWKEDTIKVFHTERNAEARRDDTGLPAKINRLRSDP